MTRPTSKATGEQRRYFWRCAWCHAGGSIQVAVCEDDKDTAWNAKKVLEDAHGRSAMCHVLRWLSQVDVSDKALPK